MKKLIINAYRDPYDNGHMDDKGSPIINSKIDCPIKVNAILHDHYGDAYDYVIEYWQNYWQKSHNYIHVNDLLEGTLQYHPSRIKDKRTGKKKLSTGVKRFTHHPKYRTDGKYYRHTHILKMMVKKIHSNYPGMKQLLEDWNEGQYMRWNCYIKWIQDWDIHHNEGLKVKDLEDCKVKINWMK